MIDGGGPEPVLHGLMLLLLEIPVYVWQRRERMHLPAVAMTDVVYTVFGVDRPLGACGARPWH